MRVRFCVLPHLAPSWSLRLENVESLASEMRRSPSWPRYLSCSPENLESRFLSLTVLLKAPGRASGFILVSPPLHSVLMTHQTVQSIPSAQGSMPSRSGTSFTTWISWRRCLRRRKSTWATLLTSCWSLASLTGCPAMPGESWKAALSAPGTRGSKCWAPCTHLQLS